MTEVDALLHALEGNDPKLISDRMEDFVLRFADTYDFSAEKSSFGKLFHTIMTTMFQEDKWFKRATNDYKLRLLQCLRLITRDPNMQQEFMVKNGLHRLVDILGEFVNLYYSAERPPFVTEILVELTSMMKRFALDSSVQPTLFDLGVHRTLIYLLGTEDGMILHCVLIALVELTTSKVASEDHMKTICDPDCVEVIVRIVQDYDDQFKYLATEILNVIAESEEGRKKMRLADVEEILVSLLAGHDMRLLKSILGILVKLASDEESRRLIRQHGGIKLIVSFISPDREHKTADAPFVISVCSALTQLALDDESAYHIRISNGVYYLVKLLISDTFRGLAPPLNVQAYIFRTLRFLFSVERNRRVFKRLFPPDLFGAFIDVPHYTKRMDVYEGLAQMLNDLPMRTKSVIQTNLADINMVKGAPDKKVREYSVLELLGKGAFGSVYQVKRDKAENVLAMKELPLQDTDLFRGASKAEVDKSAGQMCAEVEIMKELQHPNIVRYETSFHENGCLYIVMELLEGASLLDRVESLAEKGERMAEERIWSIFVQLLLALRYIHKEKKVVHRDLTPSNIMLDENDKVKITDFGLAKFKKREESVMKSMVGTLVYSCPEIVQQQPYTDKADVWSLGCVLYQMATLKPPFEGSNPLTVARKIVEGEYDKPDGFSDELQKVIEVMLTSNPAHRPDIEQVGALIAPRLMRQLDRMAKQKVKMAQIVEAERELGRRYYEEANRHKEAYHRVFAMKSQTPKSPKSPSFVPRSPMRQFRQPPGTSPMLSISPRKVRQILDPCTQFLNQLHKILFITQLPPTIGFDPRRRYVDKYKRHLFAPRNQTINLKRELQKLVIGSEEIVDLDFAGDSSYAGRETEPKKRGDRRPSNLPNLGEDYKTKITYEELQCMIEDALTEYGYYESNVVKTDDLPPTDSPPINSPPPTPDLHSPPLTPLPDPNQSHKGRH